jgi:chromatin structure-remodeling complex subunit RSC9
MNTRQTRQATGTLNSPQPNTNGSFYGTSGAAMAIANYEPRPALPSNVKPVSTPANNPEYFRQLRLRHIVNRRNKPQQPKGMMLPGSEYF